jgi:hypothetical protein
VQLIAFYFYEDLKMIRTHRWFYFMIAAFFLLSGAMLACGKIGGDVETIAHKPHTAECDYGADKPTWESHCENVLVDLSTTCDYEDDTVTCQQNFCDEYFNCLFDCYYHSSICDEVDTCVAQECSSGV